MFNMLILLTHSIPDTDILPFATVLFHLMGENIIHLWKTAHITTLPHCKNLHTADITFTTTQDKEKH